MQVSSDRRWQKVNESPKARAASQFVTNITDRWKRVRSRLLHVAARIVTLLNRTVEKRPLRLLVRVFDLMQPSESGAGKEIVFIMQAKSKNRSRLLAFVGNEEHLTLECVHVLALHLRLTRIALEGLELCLSMNRPASIRSLLPITS